MCHLNDHTDWCLMFGSVPTFSCPSPLGGNIAWPGSNAPLLLAVRRHRAGPYVMGGRPLLLRHLQGGRGLPLPFPAAALSCWVGEIRHNVHTVNSCGPQNSQNHFWMKLLLFPATADTQYCKFMELFYSLWPLKTVWRNSFILTTLTCRRALWRRNDQQCWG